nr:hypothetical protein [Nocardia alni]
MATALPGTATGAVVAVDVPVDAGIAIVGIGIVGPPPLNPGVGPGGNTSVGDGDAPLVLVPHAPSTAAKPTAAHVRPRAYLLFGICLIRFSIIGDDARTVAGAVMAGDLTVAVAVIWR